MSNLNRELRALFDDFLDDVLRAVREFVVSANKARRKAPKLAARPAPRKSEPRQRRRAKPGAKPAPTPRRDVRDKVPARAAASRPKPVPTPPARRPERHEEARTVREEEITDPEVLLRAGEREPREETQRRPEPVQPMVAQAPGRQPTVSVRAGETVLRVSTGGVVLRRAKRT